MARHLNGLSVRAAALLATAAFVLTACGGSDSPDEPGGEASEADGPSGTLTIVVSEAPQGLDPNAASSPENIAISQVAEQLFDMDTETFEYVPVLAESWELTTPTTWEFKLREGVEFSNGEPFNSAAVKYSLERTVDPEITSIAGFDTNKRFEQLRIAEITTPDDYTVVFELTDPNPLFLSRMVDTTFILAPGTAEFTPEEVNSGELIGTGPYKIAEFQSGEMLRYEPNTEYWGDGPFLEEVVLRGVPEGSSRAGELEAGSAEVAGGIPPQAIPGLESNSDIELMRTASPRRDIIQMRTTDSVFENVKVRQAVAHAIDRELIVEQIFGGHADVLASILGAPHIDESMEPHPYDPGLSKQLLTEAGLPDGFSETIHYQSGDPLVIEAVQVVQSQLAEVGIELTLQPDENAVIRQLLADKQITLAWWDQGFYGDGGRDLDSVINGVYGLTQFSEPRFDELLAAQNVEVDEATRLEMLTEMGEIFYDQVPVMPLWTIDELYGVRNTIEGFDPGIAGYWRVGKARIVE